MKKIIYKEFFFYILSIILMAIYSYAMYERIFPILFPGGDGPYSLDLLREQRIYSIFSFGTRGNSLQGLGDLDFPINTWIIPAYFLPSLFYGVESISSPKFGLLIYTLLNLQLFISIIFKYQVAGWDRMMTKITVKAKKKRAIKSSLFYLREFFRNSL